MGQRHAVRSRHIAHRSVDEYRVALLGSGEAVHLLQNLAVRPVDESRGLWRTARGGTGCLQNGSAGVAATVDVVQTW